MRLIRLAISLFAVATLGACNQTAPPREKVTVFAAASTQDVMREAGTQFTAQTGIEVVFSFDSSSTLARQIMQGSPADVFISADERWMDELQQRGAIWNDSRQDLLANDLVLVVLAGSPSPADENLEAVLTSAGRIAVGDPTHVPAGRYAEQSLKSLGLWEECEPKLVPAKDVRAALRLVELGEVDAGIVYRTDAIASSKVAVVAAFTDESHDAIRYPLAVCNDNSKTAGPFITFLRSSTMKPVFDKAGFRVLPAKPLKVP